MIAPAASDEMRFSLLGPLLVQRGGGIINVQRGKQRALLATLLLRANRVVHTDELIDTLWDSADTPPSARVTLRNYVKRLRQTLAEEVPGRISTHPAGYRISVAKEELDLVVFSSLLSKIRTAARDTSWHEVSSHARAALSLWRGEPLEDVESHRLRQRAALPLIEMRVEAIEARINAELNLGRHSELISDLHALIITYPLREQLYEFLMLALYRSGRRADALTAYRRIHQLLAEELGTEPGYQLNDLQRRILSADPSLSSSTGRQY